MYGHQIITQKCRTQISGMISCSNPVSVTEISVVNSLPTAVECWRDGDVQLLGCHLNYHNTMTTVTAAHHVTCVTCTFTDVLVHAVSMRVLPVFIHCLNCLPIYLYSCSPLQAPTMNTQSDTSNTQ